MYAKRRQEIYHIAYNVHETARQQSLAANTIIKKTIALSLQVCDSINITMAIVAVRIYNNKPSMNWVILLRRKIDIISY